VPAETLFLPLFLSILYKNVRLDKNRKKNGREKKGKAQGAGRLPGYPVE
jgi:hypothetical protein